MKMRKWLRGVGVTLFLLVGLLLPTSLVGAQGVTVSVNAPSIAAPGSDFIATVDISAVTDFDAGNFDVVFNPGVLEIGDITNGDIDGTTIPVASNEISPGRIRVVINVSDYPGVTGSGYLSKLHFQVIGSAGTSSGIDLENGILGDNLAQEIPATWVGATVNVGAPEPGPDISVSPTSKNFGEVTVGSSSSPQTVTVSNAGTANLEVGTITITGANADQFTSQNDNCSGETIAPSGLATLQVLFSPTSTGAKSATLSIPSNDPDEATVEVSLSGTGVTTAGGGGGGGGGGDTTAPRISDIAMSNITETSADISWKTHEKSDSQVEYWSSPGELSPLDEEMVINHLVHLTGLTPGTTYHYKTMSRDKAGNLRVSDEDTFTTLGEAPAAAFASSDLSISPSEVAIGETVTISVTVANTGNASGSYEMTLKINDVVDATKEVTLEAGASKEVTFTTAKDVAGSYSVAVNGLTGSFTVKVAAPPPPTPTPPAPAPTPAPAPAPTPTPEKPFNWPLVGGIIAGVVVVGLGVFFWMRRRAA